MSRFPLFSSSTIAVCSFAGAASLCLFAAFRSIQVQRKRDPTEHIIPSPLTTTIPQLSYEKVQRLPYTPDFFPGARDLDTPYGNIRIYEWGPESGKKVLLVHGISTPCVSLGHVAQMLVNQGCRVMLFDLFGRGFSDNPSDLPHDARLYTTQILLAIASSPLPWTGTNAFAIIGYSLGGGIAASFTSAHPTLVSSLVLIATSGLVRESHIAWQSKILYSTEGILPESLVQFLVRRRLDDPSSNSEEKTEAEDVLAAETAGIPIADSNDHPQSVDRPLMNIASIVQWQLENHKGFIPAFISSIRHAPIQRQHVTWAKIGQRLSLQKAKITDQMAADNGLWGSKVLMILGRTDDIVIREEIEEDAIECLGRENLEVSVIDCGHDVPITKAEDVVDVVLSFWGENVDSGEEKAEVEAEAEAEGERDWD